MKLSDQKKETLKAFLLVAGPWLNWTPSVGSEAEEAANHAADAKEYAAEAREFADAAVEAGDDLLGLARADTVERTEKYPQ